MRNNLDLITRYADRRRKSMFRNTPRVKWKARSNNVA